MTDTTSVGFPAPPLMVWDRWKARVECLKATREEAVRVATELALSQPGGVFEVRPVGGPVTNVVNLGSQGVVVTKIEGLVSDVAEG